MNRGKALYALTHTTCIATINNETGDPTGLWRCATDEEARVILGIIEEQQ